MKNKFRLIIFALIFVTVFAGSCSEPTLEQSNEALDITDNDQMESYYKLGYNQYMAKDDFYSFMDSYISGLNPSPEDFGISYFRHINEEAFVKVEDLPCGDIPDIHVHLLGMNFYQYCSKSCSSYDNNDKNLDFAININIKYWPEVLKNFEDVLIEYTDRNTSIVFEKETDVFSQLDGDHGMNLFVRNIDGTPILRRNYGEKEGKQFVAFIDELEISVSFLGNLPNEEAYEWINDMFDNEALPRALKELKDSIGDTADTGDGSLCLATSKNVRGFFGRPRSLAN